MKKEVQPVHPLGIHARVLLTSVFGPYAKDDEYGSRAINPMELYQNQVTRVQGAFSLRMFHRTFGLMMIQENIDAPCTLLDFPTRERFIEELRSVRYDVIGIGAIYPNIGKVRAMCELIRQYQPEARIVIGGHIASREGIEAIVAADHVVRGEGIRWFQRYLGQDDRAPIKHPRVLSAFGSRVMGVDLGHRPGGTAAILIPSVGCPMGCNFCSTSALFGGKGNFVNFFDTGDDLFRVMCEIEAELKTRSFFVLDENFLHHRRRALRLLELMESHDKSWAMYVFSSARVLQSYSIDQLVRLGVSWVWMGLEGKESSYDKLRGVDTHALVSLLQSHGIRVLGSTIIGLEDHRPERMNEVIDHAVSHETVFHQFMLYTPLPGTPLYERHRHDGTLTSEAEFPPGDAHGQYRFNYRHRHITDGREEGYLREAFERDFAQNGPSILRMIRVLLQGWQRYGTDPRGRIRKRIARETVPLRTTYAAAVWAIRKWYRAEPRVHAIADALLGDITAAFGWRTRLIAALVGPYICAALGKETKRLALGWSYEPPPVYRKNAAALAGAKKRAPQLAPGRVAVPTAEALPAAGMGK